MNPAAQEPVPGPAPEGTPLYVHLPFCTAKCHYCDFFSVADEGQDIGGMIDAILAEAELRAPRRPRTVFFGGGTPSLLSERELTRLLDGLDALTGFRASALEVTAECNPESLDRAKARTLLGLGVRRLSIGVQSLRPEVLELFGRVHSVDDSFRAYEAARAAGVQHVNLDLIFAVPGQSVEEWESDLSRVLALGPDHLAAYNLAFEEETRFKRWLDEGRLVAAPEEVELAMFAATRRIAEGFGLAPYEISNYAAPGEECAHNVNYWRNGPYLGLGPSAVSKVGQVRAGNPRGIHAYRRFVAAGATAFAFGECLTPRARLAETWWLGLRLAEGVEPAAARATAGCVEDPCPAVHIAEGLAATGHLELAEGRYRLTERGRPVADAVAAEFLTKLPDVPAAGGAPAPARTTGRPDRSPLGAAG